MRPNALAASFVPQCTKPRSTESTFRHGPARKISAGKMGNLVFSESRYKTELCRQFEELNECEYGDRCLFAHSLIELKPLPFRHPKFRTERCTAFSDDGFCSFGPRCSFIHEKIDPEEILTDILKDVRKNAPQEELKRLPVFEKICPSVWPPSV